jgi:hypothetical protein
MKLSLLSNRRRSLTALSLIISSTSVWAHPGHQLLISPDQPAHWLVEPAHAMMWLAALALVWSVRSGWRKLNANSPS